MEEEDDPLESIEDPKHDDENRRNPITIQSIFLDQDTFRDHAGEQNSNSINYYY